MSVSNNTHYGINQGIELNDLSSQQETSSVRQNHSFCFNKGIIESSFLGEDNNSLSVFNKRSSLKDPNVSFENLASQSITISDKSAQLLNLPRKTTTGRFIQACLDNIRSHISVADAFNKSAKNSKTVNTVNAASVKFNHDDIAYMCLMLCMDAKSKLVDTFKEALRNKVRERKELSDQYAMESKAAAEKNIEAVKKSQAAAKRQKIKTIVMSIFAGVVAVVSAVVTVATFGLASPLAAAATVCAVAGAAATVAGSTLTIIATAQSSPSQTLLNWATGLGIAGAVLSLASCITSGFAIAKSAAQLIEKAAAFSDKIIGIAKIVTPLVSNATNIGGGIFSIIEGRKQLQLAELQKKLANLKINMEKLDNDVKNLSNFIEKAGNYVQQFVKNIIEGMESVVRLLNEVMSANNNLGNRITC